MFLLESNGDQIYPSELRPFAHDTFFRFLDNFMIDCLYYIQIALGHRVVPHSSCSILYTNVVGSIGTLVKIPVHTFCRIAHDEHIEMMYGGNPTNHEAQVMTLLDGDLRYDTEQVKRHAHRPRADDIFYMSHILRLIIRCRTLIDAGCRANDEA